VSAIATFRRAMRRHERRARRRIGLDAARYLAKLRRDVASWWPDLGGYTGQSDRDTAAQMRACGSRTEAWLYERAADAVARLRAATGEAAR
jgi:hypothetical protein